MDLTTADDAYLHLKEVAARLIESLSLGREEFLVCERLLMRGNGIEQVLLGLKQNVNLANDMIRELEPFASLESISRAQTMLKLYCQGNMNLLRFLPDYKEDLSSSLAILGLLLLYSKDSSSSLANAKGYVRAISRACSEGFVPEEKWKSAEAVARGSSMAEVARKEGVSREAVRYRLSGLYPLVTIRKVKEAWRIVKMTQDDGDLGEGNDSQTEAAGPGNGISGETDGTVGRDGNSGLKGKGNGDAARESDKTPRENDATAGKGTARVGAETRRKGTKPSREGDETSSYAQGRGSVARDPIAMSLAVRRANDDFSAREAKRDELWDLALRAANSEGDVVPETDRQNAAKGKPSEASPEARKKGPPTDSPPVQERKVAQRVGGRTFSDEDCWAAVVEYMSLDDRTHSGGDYARYSREIDGMPALITVKGRLGLHWAELAETANRLLAGRIRPDEEEWARDVMAPRKWENFVRKARGSGASKRFAIELVKQCIADRGPYITHVIYSEWAEERGNTPSHALVSISGMSWNSLVKAAGGYSGRRNVGMWTKEEILKLIALYIKQERSRGEEPSIEGYSSWVRKQTAPLPNIVLVTKRVGSWVEAVKRANRYLKTDDRTLLQ
jgi:hypothetical protein